MKILKATVHHLDDLVPLFNGYRVFYKQPSDVDRATNFLTERLKKNDATIFIAFSTTGQGMGFTQLYPSYSSVSTQRTYILNDLFVAATYRNKGVGEALMNRAKEFAIAEGSKGITLETEIDNPAQHLYERLGWKKDDHAFHYTWKV